jgi:hypothetical protein
LKKKKYDGRDTHVVLVRVLDFTSASTITARTMPIDLHGASKWKVLGSSIYPIRSRILAYFPVPRSHGSEAS